MYNHTIGAKLIGMGRCSPVTTLRTLAAVHIPDQRLEKNWPRIMVANVISKSISTGARMDLRFIALVSKWAERFQPQLGHCILRNSFGLALAFDKSTLFPDSQLPKYRSNPCNYLCLLE